MFLQQKLKNEELVRLVEERRRDAEKKKKEEEEEERAAVRKTGRARETNTTATGV